MPLRRFLKRARAPAKIQTVEQMLDQIETATDPPEDVSFGAVLEAVGCRSFGPLLLLAGIILVSPLSAFPGMPSTLGVILLLTAGQLLFRREYCWMPRWLLRRSVGRGKLSKALRWLRPPARFVDRCLRPRLTAFVNGAGMRIIAVQCIVIAATLPIMELVPFSAHFAGIAVTAFGLSLISRDGLMALVALVATTGTYGWIIYSLL